MARTGQPSTGHVAASARAVAVLDALADGGELGTNEVARRTGLNASTVSRQLGTLAAAGLVEHVVENGRYRLGIRLVQLANAVLARLDVRAVARPHLEALVRATDETATLSVPGERDAITVDFVPSGHYVQHVTQLGRPSIAHASSAGKTMLAFWRGGLPAGPLEAYTPSTITDPALLAREITAVRAQGWAEACEEREPGLNAIAAPIFDAAGELEAVVALQGPVGRFDRAAMTAALPLLLEHSRAISAGLGFAGGEQPA